LLLGTLFALAALHSPLQWWIQGPLRLESIEVQGGQRLTPAEVAAATGIEKGALLETVAVEAVAERLSEHPWILSARALLLPSGRLLVRVQERVPRAALWSEDSWRWVDESGTPFAKTEALETRAMPRIRSARALATGQASPQLARAVALTLALPQHGIRGPADLRLPEEGSAEGWVLRARDGELEAVLGAERLEERIEELALLLASNLEVTQGSKRIDLRFEDRAILRAVPASR
jgi:cell division septal protein FtsQ